MARVGEGEMEVLKAPPRSSRGIMSEMFRQSRSGRQTRDS